MSSVPVYLYAPNILGYARILLALLALFLSESQPVLAVLTFTFSGVLDLFDGILARALNQTSSFGVLLDIASDNILRTCSWIAAASCGSPSIKLVAGSIISIEWITMLSTQLHAGQSEKHWKSERDQDPWLIRTVFASNFRNPIGILVIYGLFSSSLFAYGSHHKSLYDSLPIFGIFQYTAYFGRFVGLCVELWMCKSYLSLVIAKDSQPSSVKVE